MLLVRSFLFQTVCDILPVQLELQFVCSVVEERYSLVLDPFPDLRALTPPQASNKVALTQFFEVLFLSSPRIHQIYL